VLIISLEARTSAVRAARKAKNHKYNSDDETETVTVTPNNNYHRKKRVPSHDLMSPSNKVSDNSDDNSTSNIKIQSCDVVSYRGAANNKNEGKTLEVHFIFFSCL